MHFHFNLGITFAIITNLIPYQFVNLSSPPICYKTDPTRALNTLTSIYRFFRSSFSKINRPSRVPSNSTDNKNFTSNPIECAFSKSIRVIRWHKTSLCCNHFRWKLIFCFQAPFSSPYLEGLTPFSSKKFILQFVRGWAFYFVLVVRPCQSHF